LSFSLKSIIASKTVNIVSPFDKIAVSEAVVFSKPMKNRVGAKIEPNPEIVNMRYQSFLFIGFKLDFVVSGIEAREARR